jgi:hypothetical protein
MSKSILNLTITELKTIVETGVMPPEITLIGLEDHKDFQKLFRFRASPSKIAEHLLKEQLPLKVLKERGGSSDSPEIKEKRLTLKEQELDIKRLKAETQTHLLKEIITRLTDVEQKLNYIMKNLNS